MFFGLSLLVSLFLLSVVYSSAVLVVWAPCLMQIDTQSILILYVLDGPIRHHRPDRDLLLVQVRT